MLFISFRICNGVADAQRLLLIVTMLICILNENELIQELICEYVNFKMLLILFWLGDCMTDTWQLLAIVQMSLHIINVDNLIRENAINSRSTQFLMQFLFSEKSSWYLEIIAVPIFFRNLKWRKQLLCNWYIVIVMKN